MSVIPDVVGFQLEDAKEQLRTSGFQVIVKKIHPPKMKDEIGECRVIKQINADHNIELTISYF